MLEEALKNAPTLLLVVALLVTMAYDRLKKRAGDADSHDAATLKKTVELTAENAQQIRDLTASMRTLERDHNALREHATEGLKFQRGEIESFKAWRIEMSARLEPVLADYSARTVTFTTAEEASAARRRKKA